MPTVRQRAPRHGSRGAREDVEHGLAEHERDEQRRECERARDERSFEHWHLQHEATQPLGRAARELERRVSAQRGPHDRGLLELEVVHERLELLAELAHRVARELTRAIGGAVTEQVDGDHAVAERGEVFGERPVHRLAEEHAVRHDQRTPVRGRLARRPSARSR